MCARACLWLSDEERAAGGATAEMWKELAGQILLTAIRLDPLLFRGHQDLAVVILQSLPRSDMGRSPLAHKLRAAAHALRTCSRLEISVTQAAVACAEA